MLLATWFHGDTPEVRGEYAQMIGDPTSPAHWEVYLDCIDLLLASARRWDGDLRLAVVLNPAAEAALGTDHRSRWAAAGATVLVAENTHRVPAGFHGQWQNQFFVLDSLRALAAEAGPTETVVLLDGDCLVTRPLHDLDTVVQQHGRAFYAVPFDPDVEINGLSRRQLAGLSGELHGRSVEDVPYLGGEFLAFRADVVPSDLARLEEAFTWAVARARAGQAHPNEEAQLISTVLAPELSPASLVDGVVRRVWTQPWTLRNAGAADVDLAVWHLPAEKRTGLRQVHRAFLDADGWFWHAAHEDWRHRTGRLVGVPSYGPAKAWADARALAPRLLPGIRRRVAMRGRIHG